MNHKVVVLLVLTLLSSAVLVATRERPLQITITELGFEGANIASANNRGDVVARNVPLDVRRPHRSRLLSGRRFCHSV
jgi:hypothetical protein